MLLRVLVLATLVVFSFAKEKTIQRQKKLFSLFSVVTFPNNQCTGSSSSSSQEVLGTCYSETECASKGGTVDGNCAAGFGVCCTFLVSDCGSTVDNNCTYIQNPSYPTTYSTTGSCAYSVSPLSSDICQLRLDLDNFDLTETTAGVCTDSFDVTVGSSRDYMSLCGTNSGEHIYVETGRSTSTQTLTFTIATGGTWRIKVQQIECHSISKAPSDCYQYLTGISGSIESFNYATVMLTDTLYTICVRQEEGYCGIEWSEAATTSPDPFDLGTGTVGLALGTTATGSEAYIGIPGSVNQNYGGTHLSEDTTTTAADQDTTSGSIQANGMPFQVVVNTYGAAAGVLGFNLVYNQVPCSSGITRPN